MTPLKLSSYDLIVMGASAGGVEALGRFFQQLPTTWRLPIACVIHVPSGSKLVTAAFPTAPGYEIVEAEDKTPLEPGRIFFAPADYHLMVESDGHLSLSVEEPVLFARPAIDMLFESAARAYGPRLLAVLLTGANTDGTNGLRKVRERGGFALVQNPDSARSPTMPESAVNAGTYDLIFELDDVAGLFANEISPAGTATRGES